MGKAGARRRHELAAARRRRGWSQEDAAERVNVATSTWARWERGEVCPQASQRADLAAVFGVPLEEVARWIDWVEEQPVDPLTLLLGGDVNQSTLAAIVEGARELWRTDVDPSRRALVSALPFVPAALSEWLLSYIVDPAPESRAHVATSVRTVGMEDVHQVHDAVDAFMVMDHRFGGGLVRPAIVDYLHTRLAPLLAGSYSDEVGSRLLTAAAVMTGLAGWEAFDLGQDGLAQAHYGQALRLAKAADDPLTAALMLASLAQQAVDLQQPELAVRLARAARMSGDQGNAGVRLRATLMVREARATAVAIDLAETPDPHTVSRVERLLGKVEASFADFSDDNEEPHWAYDLDETELTAEAGCVWRMIGHYRRAEACAVHALEGFDAAFARSRQFNAIHRGEALLGLGELDAALDSARQSVALASGLQSARSVALLQSFDAQLEPHAREPKVRQWRKDVRAAVSTHSSGRSDRSSSA